MFSLGFNPGLVEEVFEQQRKDGDRANPVWILPKLDKCKPSKKRKATLDGDEDTDELFKLIEKKEKELKVNMLTLTKLNTSLHSYSIPLD